MTPQDKLKSAIAADTKGFLHREEMRQDCLTFCLKQMAKLTTEWQRVSANNESGDPDLFRAAEMLCHYGVVERKGEPARYETRRNWYTGKSETVGVGAIIYFKLKEESN